MAYAFDAEVQDFIERSDAFYPADAVHFSVAEQREWYDKYCAAFRGTRPAGVETQDVKLTSGGLSVPVRRYSPAATESETVVLYFHGGGFVVGGLDSHDGVCAEICARTGQEVVAVDYRLCPEHPHPAAFDDAWAAFMVVSGEGRPIILAGDSAGACLAASVAIEACDQGNGQVKGQVLVYPMLGDVDTGSRVTHAHAPMLTSEDVDYYHRIRVADVPVRRDHRLLPLYAEDFSDLPPAVLFAAEVDPLCDDCALYATALRDAGGDATVHVEKGLVHGYLRARTVSTKARESFDRICEAVASFA